MSRPMCPRRPCAAKRAGRAPRRSAEAKAKWAWLKESNEPCGRSRRGDLERHRARGRIESYELHNREQMPERVGIPGFGRGRRYIAKHGTPEFFILYEADSAEVLSGRTISTG